MFVFCGKILVRPINQIFKMNCLTVPCPKYLRSLSTAVRVETGLPSSIVKYLVTRIKHLKSRERNVNLIIEELYFAESVELVKGKFFGCKNNQTIKTVLTFIIKSVEGNYMDVVAHILVVKLNAEFLNYENPLSYRIYRCGCISYNHSINRKFFTHFLCGIELKTSITHPHNNRKIHLFFDPGHKFKNIYNCFHKKEYFIILLNRLRVKSSSHPNFVHFK
uniref:THAP domaincontaining protein 9like [Hydra vulgaris] n=1 Tax=Lepeophtheirus salmonis TaxID=72036 RepID=A0A0K2T3D8_LEPSM